MAKKQTKEPLIADSEIADQPDGTLSRRDLVGKLAVGAAGAAVVWAASGGRAAAATTNTQARPHFESPDIRAGAGRSGEAVASSMDRGVVDARTPATLSQAAPWELLHPFTAGSEVGYGWRVTQMTGISDGTCVITLENARGRAHRLHVCRNDGNPQGIVYTANFDLVAMNGGQGDLPTEEGFAQAVAEIAHALANNEARFGTSRTIAALMPHSQRLEMFSGREDRRLR